MPRDRPSQPPQAPNAQAYGQRGDQIAAQRQMPLPQTDTGPAMPANGGGAGASDVDVMAQAAAFDPGIVPLGAGSQRPGEPVTAGLSGGPGPGPEVFARPGRSSRAADLLESMGMSTNDESLVNLAMKIRQRGGV